MIASGQQKLMAKDFDVRIEIIPVSDPNIFSMSQRVMLAQEMMQMVQTNPQIHGPQGMYEAYRRMYEAMGVQQVEQLLPPPPQPQPASPSMENSGFLQGQPAQAFPDQDHDAHIKTHLLLFKLPIIQKVPEGQMQAAAVIQSHIYQHIDFKAREMAQQDPEVTQMNQQIQQMQQQAQMDPMMMQQVQMQVQQMQQQMQAIMEDKVAQTTVELLQKLESDLQIGQEEDPFVDLRREELDLNEENVYSNAQVGEQ